MKSAIVFALLASCTSMIKTSTSSSPDSAAPNGDITMPNLIGMSEEEAIAAVEKAGFRNAAESNHPLECVDAQEVEGRVNCQDPEAGATVKNYTLVHIHVYERQHLAGLVVRDQMLALLGKTPDDAKKALKSYGHDGSVKVEPDTKFHDGCGDNRVCSFDQPEAGMGIHDDITLYVNPRLTIDGPPE